MKKAIAGVISLVLLFTLALWWKGQVDSLVASIEEDLSVSIAALEQQQPDAGRDSASKARDTWDGSESMLALFINHDITDNIDLSFEKAEALLDQDEITHAITELMTIAHILRDLQNNLKMTWRNIF